MSTGIRSEYKRTFADEFDWSMHEQLHRAVLQIGAFCFRTKQMCVAVEVAIIGLLVKIVGDQLDESVFVAGLVIPICFWFLDAVGYYYQEKLRALMAGYEHNLRRRNESEVDEIVDAVGTLSAKRVERSWARRVFVSGFNNSMWLYAFLVGADGIIWAVYKKGMIG